MKLTHRITEKRTSLGLTQQQLADQLGWTLRKLTSYERNERIPPLPEALELAKALKTEVEDIWTLEKGDI
jgi:putative transcriptional regulator